MSRGAELLKMARASLFRSHANANRRMTDTVSLCKAYKDWQSEHGLYLGDVPEIPEHLGDGQLTTNEREWLRAFIQRWNAACDRERASAVAT
jgi:type IV pilus biogenesis protein CpaD/CtpE